MRKGFAGLGIAIGVLLGTTFANWMYQWSDSMKARADRQCTDEKDRLLLVPGAITDPESYEGEPGTWKPLHRWVSCQEMIKAK